MTTKTYISHNIVLKEKLKVIKTMAFVYVCQKLNLVNPYNVRV